MRIACWLLLCPWLALAWPAQAQSIEELEKRLEALQREEAAKEAQTAQRRAAEQAAAKRRAEEEARLAMALVRSDVPCQLRVNGEDKGVVEADSPRSLKLPPGEQLIECVSTQAASARYSEVKALTSGTQSVVLIELAGKVQTAQREAQAQAERERQQQAEAARRQALQSRWVAQGDGTVRDTQTGVVWADRDNGSNIDWQGARQFCASKGAGWDLPSVAELQGLVDKTGTLSQQCGSSTCRVTPTINLSEWWAWSRERDGSSSAFGVYLLDGLRDSLPVSVSSDGRALCVRRSS